MRFVCWFTGKHKWGNPAAVLGLPNTYEAECLRCGRSIKGNWDWMERNGAWKHYRSSEVGFWTVLKAILREWWHRNVVADDAQSAIYDRIDREIEEHAQATEAWRSHRWSGWPGAWCLDCGAPDPLEQCLAAHDVEPRTRCSVHVIRTCEEPGSKRHDPYAAHA